MSATAKSKANNVVNLATVRGTCQKALTRRQIEQHAPARNGERRMPNTGDERRLLWISNAEAELLSCMYEHGVKPAAMRLLISGGAK
jgi:hypothetical protein